MLTAPSIHGEKLARVCAAQILIMLTQLEDFGLINSEMFVYPGAEKQISSSHFHLKRKLHSKRKDLSALYDN